MDDPDGTWTGMGQFLGELPAGLPMQPRAILVVSGHWETPGFMLTANPKPSLLFDYYGFPPHTYQLRYDAPGAPDLALRAAQLLREAGFSAGLDAQRGLDHGVFVPLKMIYPQAQLPVVELSLDRSLDASLQLAVGRALAPLRDEGVLLLCAGMSFHNLRALGDARDAPAARFCHPRPEHLLPLMVAAGASESPGQRIFNEQVLGTMISGFSFA
jgi:aromatic ring-opening dioxygenase catalytic subunit (LigB family)